MNLCAVSCRCLLLGTCFHLAMTLSDKLFLLLAGRLEEHQLALSLETLFIVLGEGS